MNALEKYAAKKYLARELRKVAFLGAAVKGVRALAGVGGKAATRTGAGVAGGAILGASRRRSNAARPPAPPAAPKLTSPFGNNPPKPGTPTAKRWTSSANRNAQRTGAGGRWNFNTQQSQPVTQSTQSGLTTGR